MTRADGRAFDQLRPVEMTPGFTKFAEGSVLIRCGETWLKAMRQRSMAS